MLRRSLLAALAATALAGSTLPAAAQETVKIGLIIPLTGPFTTTGKQLEAAARLYMQQNGTTVAGKKIELIVRDDAGRAENTARIAGELIQNDKVSFIAGFGLTPLAMATAPIATNAKVPMVVMMAGTSIITERSPYIVRTSFTLGQSAVVIADWAAKNKIKKVVTLVTDYAPGHDAEKSFVDQFKSKGGEIVESIRVPIQNPDFAPFLQRVLDAKPDALYVFTPSGQGSILMKQFIERGLDKSGIRLIGTGDITDDDILNGFGDAAIGVVTAHNYSTAHPSPKNQEYVAAFKKANPSLRPNFASVGAYDGMHLIYEALKKTNGNTDGDALLAAMKGMKWESPRGPISIDPETRDIVQTIYIRKVEKKDGELYNIEFESFPDIKDPVKAAKK
ncbi:MAG: ABC transporter substrate-binding protein [Xanthobacteraceae bacterium]|nr:ABC transporter substrate-binding protein [Xanthobacteraceae bacterium]MBX3549749.1 ABC transporter substrate-binding protein [Xanthobacteraceae bacterium]MCW5676765.1 ABC transporter substrate-binding protein [Xanthobacteraceae bacterium]